jgi:hypothetical protein
VAGAAKAQGNPESFQDALGDIFMAIANAKLSPDADLGFLNKIEMVVMGRLKQPPAQPGGAQPPGSQGPPGGGAPGSPPPAGAPPGGQAAPPQGGPNPHAAIPPPDMDDVRKTVAASTGP